MFRCTQITSVGWFKFLVFSTFSKRLELFVILVIIWIMYLDQWWRHQLIQNQILNWQSSWNTCPVLIQSMMNPNQKIISSVPVSLSIITNADNQFTNVQYWWPIFLETPTPEEWTDSMNPPYSYYLWYMYANITMINQVRKERGLNCFNLRHSLCSLAPGYEAYSLAF